ncbi:uroplakin-3b [Chiroxiphia lanceolata]|uniref:uroplakin-3b n=1 Tax=Chiroxiphia lanceolata TaxID=296741 RepID=UPI0013CEA460|nr:uroplakin-3b [Chiroxiphia lanceolata]
MLFTWEHTPGTPSTLQGEVLSSNPIFVSLDHVLTAIKTELLPYVPRVPPVALLGKVTATTFALERPCCIFDRHASASDTVWLAVAFANASATFRNPPSRADVPLYKQLPTTHSYMTLETAAAAYACPAPSPAVLRVGGDTACKDQSRQDPCNGPLPSPGPYRVKFLLMGCHGPKAETRWSDPILLRRALSPSTIDPVPTRHGSDVVVIASLLASLGTVLATAVLGALGAKVWGSLCQRDLGTSAFTCRSYQTHHIPPALPQPPPPGWLSPTRATNVAVLNTLRRRALKHNKCSQGNEPNLFAAGLRPVQECGRLV